MDSSTGSIRFRILTGLFLFVLSVDWCEADTEPFVRIVSKNAMWISGLAAGLSLLLCAIIVLAISTLFIRLLDKKRMQTMISIAPIMIGSAPTDDGELYMDKGTGAAPLSLFISAIENHGPASDADMRAAGGHVYYNRAMDIAESPEVGRATLDLDEKPPRDTGASRKRSPEISVC